MDGSIWITTLVNVAMCAIRMSPPLTVVVQVGLVGELALAFHAIDTPDIVLAPFDDNWSVMV